jgi:DNA-binding MarR family transcriptional regulator
MHGYNNRVANTTRFVHDARMAHWSDELHSILLQITSVMNRPDVDERFLARAGVRLDRALYPLLSRIGALGPIGTVELAAQVGRDHSTVSRQVAKLEKIGLVARSPSASDKRVRMLQPSPQGQRMIEKFVQARRGIADIHFSDWTEAEKRQLLRLLRKLARKSTI